jgi:hypothetical protein
MKTKRNQTTLMSTEQKYTEETVKNYKKTKTNIY